MTHFRVQDFGQLQSADLSFGDLTLLVGPQATGKSVLLQLFKLAQDHQSICHTLKQHGYDWQSELTHLLEVVFGEGMGGLHRDGSTVSLDDERIDLKARASETGRRSRKAESVFLVPAQRVLMLENGWPRPFDGFQDGTPYVLRNFSEQLRQLMEKGLGGGDGLLFPKTGRMKKALRDQLDESMFHGAQVQLETINFKRRIVIDADNNRLPFMTWSAGQREFMPLLLGLYWLMPSSGGSKKPEIDWVVIEEPEMGLHPQAILSVMLIALELMQRGYKVVISTHSPMFLEMAWVLRVLKEHNADPESLYALFQLERSPAITEIFRSVLDEKTLTTSYFEPQANGKVVVQDISSLDPFDENEAVADWGGLTSFSTLAADVVAAVIQEATANEF